MKPIHQTFNDGYLKYGHKVTNRSERGKRIGDIFQEEGTLAFHLLNARDQDYSFAGMMGASLDLKIKIRYPPSFRKINRSKLICVIDNIEYDVIKVDNDNDYRYLYFYLQRVGEIDE
nr:head-tail adaptor protein [Bacillaceae bacterium]